MASQHIAHVEQVLGARPYLQGDVFFVWVGQPVRRGAAGLDGCVGCQGHVHAQVQRPCCVCGHVVFAQAVLQRSPAQVGVDVDALIDGGLLERAAIFHLPLHGQRSGDAVERGRRARHDAQAQAAHLHQARVLHHGHAGRVGAGGRLVPRLGARGQFSRHRCAQHAAIEQAGQARIARKQRLAGDEGVQLAGRCRRFLGCPRARLQAAQRAGCNVARSQRARGLALRQGLAQGGAGAGQGQGKVLHAGAAHGGAYAGNVAGAGQLQMHLRGRHTQLCSGQALQCGADLLAHFGAGQPQGEAAIFVPYPAQRVVGGGGGALGDHRHQAAACERDGECTCRRCCKKLAALHGVVPPAAGCPAAWWMAARTRCWVPQRHRWPDMAASICASLGRGVARSRATAPMIWPLWQ